PENWADETTAAATVAGGEAASGSGVGKLLTVLPSSAYRLTAIDSRLRSSGTYLPVAHAAWVQTASAWGTHAGFPLDSLGINVPGLTGDIFLEHGQFLHLGMTLNYTMQDPPAGLNAPAGTTFVMNETRRVRFYQRNYYDHPAFGVIALITPARGPRPPGGDPVRKSILAGVALSVLCAACAAARSTDQPCADIAAAVDAAVRPVLEKYRIPGMAVGLVAGSRTCVFNYGVADTTTRKPVTDGTLFELGSVTKTFTATEAAYAQVRGYLSLSDTAG